MLNVAPCNPVRRCLKRAGPREVRRTARPTPKQIGRIIGADKSTQMISKMRLVFDRAQTLARSAAGWSSRETPCSSVGSRWSELLRDCDVILEDNMPTEFKPTSKTRQQSSRISIEVMGTVADWAAL